MNLPVEKFLGNAKDDVRVFRRFVRINRDSFDHPTSKLWLERYIFAVSLLVEISDVEFSISA